MPPPCPAESRGWGLLSLGVAGHICGLGSVKVGEDIPWTDRTWWRAFSNVWQIVQCSRFLVTCHNTPAGAGYDRGRPRQSGSIINKNHYSNMSYFHYHETISFKTALTSTVIILAAIQHKILRITQNHMSGHARSRCDTRATWPGLFTVTFA